jgi:hypothetical protein
VSLLRNDPAIEQPIGWEAQVPSAELTDRDLYLKLQLRADTAPGGLRVSPLHDFGRLQAGGWAQGSLLLDNVGGETLEVRDVRFSADSAQPEAFSFIVAGEPVAVPLPVEGTTRTDGGLALRWSADAADAALLTVKEDLDTISLTLGDRLRGPGTELLTVYGEPVRLVGDRLLRDDPASRPAQRSGGTRPFGLLAFAERRPPFLLAPGERVEVDVIAQPATVGVKQAGILVEAVEIANPAVRHDVVGRLIVEALSGPQAHVLPHLLWFRREAGTLTSTSRRALIENVGHFDLEVSALRLSGPSAGRFAIGTGRVPPFRLAPGESADIQLTFTPECDGSYPVAGVADHQATLVIDTDDVDPALPLYGVSGGYCTP